MMVVDGKSNRASALLLLKHAVSIGGKLPSDLRIQRQAWHWRFLVISVIIIIALPGGESAEVDKEVTKAQDTMVVEELNNRRPRRKWIGGWKGEKQSMRIFVIITFDVL